MNKAKKISMAVVATVMAGAMIVPLAACGGNTPSRPERPEDGVHVVEDGLSVKVKDGVLDYAANTQIDTALGYDNTERGIKFNSKLITNVGFGGSGVSSATFAGKTYSSDDLKPAWRELSDVLNVKISDTWTGTADEKAGVHIKTLKGRPEGSGFNDRGLITASADTIVTESVNDSLLDINKYLDYIPNYKAFIEADDAVRLSVTADTDTGAMYLIPYFDGNNDIEKYVLMRKDIVEKILDAEDLSAATGTFAGQAAAKNSHTQHGVATIVGTDYSVKSFMGTTGSYEIATTDPDAMDNEVKSFGNNSTAVKVGHDKDTVTLVVDYGKVINTLKDTNSDLYKAVAAALPTGTTVQVESGNIIDIQNQIIHETQGACTGAELTKVLQEYIKVAYHKKGANTAFYTKLSDVFNSAYAAWDVDLYVALGRCAMTSNGLLGNSTRGEGVSYFLGSRAMQTNRNYNEASFAGELYGVRGLTSRYANLYTYIGKDGKMRDARANTDTWDALNNMHGLVLEGLLYTGEGVTADYGSIAGSYNEGTVQIYSSTDYVQTQTAKGGFAVDGALGTTIQGKVESDYNFAPILTPISKWDTDDNGTHETVMRFTESWRGVKDGGICIPKEYVKNNPDRLSAVLAVIDWMYSNDGQMVLTYGPHSEAGNITREQGKTESDDYGTWYGKEVTGTVEGVDATDMDALFNKGVVSTYDNSTYFVTKDYQSKYFCYGNKLYTGTLYNGKQVPIPTDEVYTVLYTNSKPGSFTDMARWFIGSALNFGNKDQGFEAQCTSKCGLAGAEIWAIANVNGTIKHTLNKIDSKNWWYTLSPTILPFDEAATESMKTQYQKVSGKGDTAATNYFYQSGDDKSNLLMDIIYYGYNAEGGTKTITGMGEEKIPTSAQGIIDLLNNVYNGHGLDMVDGFMEDAWAELKDYYDTLSNH